MLPHELGWLSLQLFPVVSGSLETIANGVCLCLLFRYQLQECSSRYNHKGWLSCTNLRLYSIVLFTIVLVHFMFNAVYTTMEKGRTLADDHMSWTMEVINQCMEALAATSDTPYVVVLQTQSFLAIVILRANTALSFSSLALYHLSWGSLLFSRPGLMAYTKKKKILSLRCAMAAVK